MPNIEITNPELCTWIASLHGNKDEVHAQIEATLNIGRLCMEQCRLKPNFDLIHRPLEVFAESIKQKIDSNLVRMSEKDDIYNSNIQAEMKLLRETVNELLSIKGSSNRKGKIFETLEMEIISRNFPNYIVMDMSNVDHESDIQLETPHGKVLVELKTYTSNVNNDQIKKFYRDIDRVGCPYALFISNTSGIVGKKKFEWEYYGPRKTLCVFVANGGLGGEGLLLALNFLECYAKLITKLDKTLNIETHIGNLVSCIERAQAQIEPLCRLRGDLKLIKEMVIKKTDEIAEGMYSIEFGLKTALNQVVEETRSMCLTDLPKFEIGQLEELLQEKGYPVADFLALDRVISLTHPGRFQYSISPKDEFLVIDQTTNNGCATIKKLKTKKDFEVSIPFHANDYFTFNPKIETISKNTIVLSLTHTEIIAKRIIEFASCVHRD
jgi:hypothetical protein